MTDTPSPADAGAMQVDSLAQGSSMPRHLVVQCPVAVVPQVQALTGWQDPVTNGVLSRWGVWASEVTPALEAQLTATVGVTVFDGADASLTDAASRTAGWVDPR